MKIVVVTGTLAEPLVQSAITETTTHAIEVVVLPLAIAAFLHPKYVSAQIRLRSQLQRVDLILLPGMVAGDTKLVTEATGIPTYKGPQHAADLPLLFETFPRKYIS